MCKKTIDTRKEAERRNSLIDAVLGKSSAKGRTSKSARNLEICMRRIGEKKAKKNQVFAFILADLLFVSCFEGVGGMYLLRRMSEKYSGVML